MCDNVVQHVLGIAHFTYNESTNTHSLDDEQYQHFKHEVERLQPTVQQTARREARIASRIANQHSDTIRNTRTTLDTTTRSGRRSGRARSKEFKLVVERWKHSFTHIMDNLNWVVYSIEHLSEEKYNEITHEGREAHPLKV